MHKGDFDFDQLVTTLAEDENERKNTIDVDGWGLDASEEVLQRGAPKRRKVSWIVPTLGAGLVMGGAAILILEGYMRPRAVAHETPAVEGTFATVSPAPARGPHDPVVEDGRTLPEKSAKADSAAAAPSEQIPAATAARRALERQRPVPAGHKADKDDGSVDPEALLALAGQEKAESKAAVGQTGSVVLAAAGGKAAPAAEKSEGAAEEKLPDSLSRGLVHKGFQSIKSKVLACKDKLPEGTTVIQVMAMIRPDGTVEDAAAEGAVGDSAAGACIAAAVKSASFARFSGTEPQKVSYPFPVN